MLISTGNTYRLELNTGMAINGSNSEYSRSTGEEIRGIRSLLGQSLSSVLGSNFIGSSSITLQPMNMAVWATSFLDQDQRERMKLLLGHTNWYP